MSKRKRYNSSPNTASCEYIDACGISEDEGDDGGKRKRKRLNKRDVTDIKQSTDCNTEATPSSQGSPFLERNFLFSFLAQSQEKANGKRCDIIHKEPSDLELAMSKKQVGDIKHNCNLKLRTFLQQNFIKLKEEFDPDGLADRLCEFDAMTDSDRERIREAGYHLQKSDIFIKVLVKYSKKLAENDRSFIDTLLACATKEKCEHLFEGFNIDEEINKEETFPSSTSDDWKEKLSDFERQNGDEVDTKNIIDNLLQEEVLGFDEHDNIIDIQFKPDKLNCVVKYVQGKSRGEYVKFMKVINKEYPYLNSKESMPANQPYGSKVSLMDISEGFCLPSKQVNQTELTLSLCGNGEEIERMVVDDNSNDANEAVTEELMDCAGFDVKTWKFSSIHLLLKSVSKRSNMILHEKMKSPPLGFIEKLVQKIFSKEHFHKLHERGITMMNFKLQIYWPDKEIRREDVAKHYCLLKGTIEPRSFIGLVRSANATETLVQVLDSSHSRLYRCKEFLMYLVNDKNSPIDKFYIALQSAGILNDVKLKTRLGNQCLCSCKLSKRSIVEGFQTFLKDMSNIREILRTFEEFRGFDENIRSSFRNLLMEHDKEASKSTDCTHNESDAGMSNADEGLINDFLSKILDTDDGIAVCLLERELRETKQMDMLQDILKTPFKVNEFEITAEDIRKNETFLLNELEPRRFLAILEGTDGLDVVKDIILSKQPRRERCMALLDITEMNPIVLKKFGSELDRLRITRVIDYLCESRNKGSGENKLGKEDITRNSGFLQEEIEPRKFLNMLRGVTGSEEIIEIILSSTTRRLRCRHFYDFLVKGREDVIQKFQEKLEKLGMLNVIKFLINTRPERFDDSSSIKEALVNSYQCIINEIETKELRNIYVERQMLTATEFDSICQSETRGGRAVHLMQYTMRGPVTRAYCLLGALEATGYVSLAKSIRKNMDEYKPCPRLYKAINPDADQFVIEGQLKIDNDFAQSNEDPTAGNGPRLPSTTVDKQQLITEWFEKHDGTSDISDIGEDPTFSANCERIKSAKVNVPPL